MLAKEIHKILNADERTSAELGKAAGLHAVSIRQFRTNVERLNSASLRTVDKLLHGLKARISVITPKAK